MIPQPADGGLDRRGHGVDREPRGEVRRCCSGRRRRTTSGCASCRVSGLDDPVAGSEVVGRRRHAVGGEIAGRGDGNPAHRADPHRRQRRIRQRRRSATPRRALRRSDRRPGRRTAWSPKPRGRRRGSPGGSARYSADRTAPARSPATRPRGDWWAPAADASASSNSARIRAASASRRLPASVGATRRVVRVNSRAPIRASSAVTSRVTAGGDRFNRRAAALKAPSSATATKTESSRKRSIQFHKSE